MKMVVFEPVLIYRELIHLTFLRIQFFYYKTDFQNQIKTDSDSKILYSLKWQQLLLNCLAVNSCYIRKGLQRKRQNIVNDTIKSCSRNTVSEKTYNMVIVHKIVN